MNTSKTDWDRLRKIEEAEIDVSETGILADEFFEKAELRLPAGKVPVLLNMDEEIAEWFRQQAGDFRQNLNDALRDYAHSHKGRQ